MTELVVGPGSVIAIEFHVSGASPDGVAIATVRRAISVHHLDHAAFHEFYRELSGRSKAGG